MGLLHVNPCVFAESGKQATPIPVGPCSGLSAAKFMLCAASRPKVASLNLDREADRVAPALLIRALADEPAGLLLAANTLFHGSHAHACSWGVCSRGPDRTCWSGGWGRALPPVAHPGRLSQARQPLRCSQRVQARPGRLPVPPRPG